MEQAYLQIITNCYRGKDTTFGKVFVGQNARQKAMDDFDSRHKCEGTGCDYCLASWDDAMKVVDHDGATVKYIVHEVEVA